MEKSSQTPAGVQEAQAQALADFGEILLSTFDRLKAAGDKDAMRAWLDFLHGDDRVLLSQALGKRALDKLGTREAT